MADGSDIMTVDTVLLKRLTYAKYLHGAAAADLVSPSALVAAEALLRLHDSIEIFQLVVLDKLGVPRKQGGGFMEFWEQVKSKGAKEPPYKDRLRQLNEMRVAFKHHAILPHPTDLRELSAAVHPFFVEVSEEILGLDFSMVSLADLVDDPNVREHMKSAERSIRSQEYQDAVSEITIAFYLVVHQKYSEIPKYLGFSSGLFAISHPPKLNLGDIPYEAQAAVHEIEKALESLHSQLQEQGEMLEMLAWKIDWQRYTKFKYLTPNVFQTGDGKFHLNWQTSLGRPHVKKDCEFCFQFVLDTALAIQAQKFRLPDRFKPYQIKTIGDPPTALYRVDSEGNQTRIADIPKDVQLLGTHCFPPKFGEAWHVNYQDLEGVIKSSEVTLVSDE